MDALPKRLVAKQKLQLSYSTILNLEHSKRKIIFFILILLKYLPHSLSLVSHLLSLDRTHQTTLSFSPMPLLITLSLFMPLNPALQHTIPLPIFSLLYRFIALSSDRRFKGFQVWVKVSFDCFLFKLKNEGFLGLG